MRRVLPLLLAAVLAGGCGGAEGPDGTATVWVTRDEGKRVLLVREVPAGLTAMQALDRVADVETRYGGRFVESIEGLEGSLSSRHDWFYFVNGYEADRSASEYTLHDGDVEWWDFRSWAKRQRAPVVVGAFPEPFLHGYDGKTRPAVVTYPHPRFAQVARRLAQVVGGQAYLPRALPAVEAEFNEIAISAGKVEFVATGDIGTPVRFVIGPGDAARLARNPALARFRYEGLP
ncbi:MAG: DUF4430 domain-containing protein [Gaiellaceae bacterium]